MVRYLIGILALMFVTTQPNGTMSAWSETEMMVSGPVGPLRGTLLVPSGPVLDVVMILPGSGPTDRDGNSPLGIQAATYRLLAEGLADHGMASLRTDKRGLFGSAAAVSDPNAVTLQDYVTDTHAWVEALRERLGGACIWLAGHSEGGLIAMAASEDLEGLCGLILLAAPGKTLGETLREQLQANPANQPFLKDAFAAIDRLEAGEQIDDSALPTALLPLFRADVQGFLISLFAVDPAELLARYPGPTLIVQAGRDLQVEKTHGERLAKAAPAAEVVMLAEANHVLKDVNTDSRAVNLAAYADPDLPLSPDLIPAIVAFVGSQ
ncbi:MAG: alpha/beta fold hydrolase [Pseudomonadota bacterium]